MEEKLYLRDVNTQDKELLFDWCNEKECRKNSLNQGKISYEQHSKWFAKKINSPNCFFYILMRNNTAVGQIRIDEVNGIGTISYSIELNYRGKGYGKKILSLIESEKIIKRKIYYLKAIVKKNNRISQLCFQQLGYHLVEIGDICCYWKYI